MLRSDLRAVSGRPNRSNLHVGGGERGGRTEEGVDSDWNYDGGVRLRDSAVDCRLGGGWHPVHIGVCGQAGDYYCGCGGLSSAPYLPQELQDLLQEMIFSHFDQIGKPNSGYLCRFHLIFDYSQ